MIKCKKKKNGLVVESIGLSSSAVRLVRFFTDEEKYFCIVLCHTNVLS